MNIRTRRQSSANLVDVTPLIDVVFLLLIFFMVSTTFDKETRLKVDLPEASTEASARPAEEKIEIIIDSKGRFFVNDEELIRHDLHTLKKALWNITQGRPDIPVVITGDKSAPYQAAMTVLDAAGQMGLTQLSFVARKVE